MRRNSLLGRDAAENPYCLRKQCGNRSDRRKTRKNKKKTEINVYFWYNIYRRAVGAAVARPPHTRKVTGSNPVLPTIFLHQKSCFVVALSVGYLRANARVPPVSLPQSRLETRFFILKISPHLMWVFCFYGGFYDKHRKIYFRFNCFT